MEASEIARGGARSLVFRVLTAIASTLVVVVTARGFGAEGRGLYALASFAGSTIITTLGGGAAALGSEVAHKRASIPSLQAAALLIAGVGGAVVGLLMAAAVWVVWPDAQVLLYAAAAAPPLILGVLQIGLYQAMGRVATMHWIGLGVAAVPLLGLTIVAFAAPGDTYLALAVWAASQWIVPLVALAVQRVGDGFRFRGLRSLLERLVRRGLPISLANGIALLNYRVDLLVVAAMLSLSDVGRYSVAIAMGESLLLLSRAVNTGAYAQIISLPNDQSAQLMARAVRHAVGLLIMGGVLLSVSAVVLIEPVFGDAFDGVVLPLVLLLPGLVALGGITEFVRLYFLIRLERSREYLLTASVAMLVNLGLAVLLIPPLGLAGAALSTSISYLTGASYLLNRFARENVAVRLTEFVPRSRDLQDYRQLLASVREGRPQPS